MGLVPWLWHRLVGRRGEPGTARGYLFRLTTPIVSMLLVTVARRFMNEQVNHSDDIATVVDIEVRAHVDTQDYGEFTGVQQELLMIIYEIVEAAGSGFAFPSSTTYLATDSGLPEPLDSALIGSAVGATPGPFSERTAPVTTQDEVDVTGDAIDD